ncbi:MAG TPA: MFS transporter [Caulobacteraceae bacterium]|nr:MFS transporter [Caulobacteraceae bacterium]
MQQIEAERSVGARLDALPARAVWPLVVLISLGAFFEFYDLMMTAYISPILVRDGVFHLGARGLFGLDDQASFAAATFLGLFVGTIAFARIADRFGRRAIFTFSLIWYTAATLVMAAANGPVGVDLARFFAGVGVGVELVTIDAYLAELAGPGRRGRVFAVSQAIQFTAVPVVAFVSLALAPRTVLGLAGWRWVAILGAAAALAVWFIRARLPESPRWLAAHGRLAEAWAIVERLEGGHARSPAPVSATASAPIAEAPKPAPAAAVSPFAPAWRGRTVMLTVFNLAQAIGYYGFANWAPALIAARGHPILKSLLYGAVIAIAWPLSSLACAPLADRLERRRLIALACLATAALGLLFGVQTAPAALIVFGVAIVFSNNLMSLAFHAYQAEVFPTLVRARAAGFVYAWSRLSTALSSFAIAALLRAAGVGAVFAFIALAMVTAAAAVGLFGPPARGRALETI